MCNKKTEYPWKEKQQCLTSLIRNKLSLYRLIVLGAGCLLSRWASS